MVLVAEDCADGFGSANETGGVAPRGGGAVSGLGEPLGIRLEKGECDEKIGGRQGTGVLREAVIPKMREEMCLFDGVGSGEIRGAVAHGTWRDVGEQTREVGKQWKGEFDKQRPGIGGVGSPSLSLTGEGWCKALVVRRNIPTFPSSGEEWSTRFSALTETVEDVLLVEREAGVEAKQFGAARVTSGQFVRTLDPLNE